MFRSFARTIVLAVLFNAVVLTSARSAAVPSFVPKAIVKEAPVAHGKLQLNVPVSTTANSMKEIKGGFLPANEVKSTLVLIVLDHLFRKAFLAKGIPFPSQLGGCCILFTVMVVAECVKPGVGDGIFAFLSPGAGLLAKWLPVFFVPGLAMLPNAPSMGSPIEILKVLLTVVLGFYYTASTTAFSVLTLRKMQGAITEAPACDTTEVSDSPTPAPALPFSAGMLDSFVKAAVLTGAVNIGAHKLGTYYCTPLNTLFMLITTFAGYVWGARLPAAFTKIVHPLVTSTAVTLAATKLVALITGGDFTNALSTYKSGSLAPMDAGAGDILLYLLGPTVVSFAIAMYSRKKVMVDNLAVVLTSMIVASVGSLFGTAAFVRLLKIGGEAGAVLRKSLLPRNITTPLAIAITNIIGGDISQAAAVVVMTGIFGATFGARTFTAFGITDPVTRGLGQGASGQGLGVAAFVNEKEAFPFAAISMVLTAVAATTLVSIPPVKDVLLKLATGQ